MKLSNQLPLNSIPKWVKIGSIILVILVLLVFGSSLYLSRMLEAQLKPAIQKATKGIYSLEYEKANVSIFNSSISLQNVILKIDTTLAEKRLQANKPLTVFVEGNFPAIRLKRVHWLKFLLSKKLTIGEFNIQNPNITVKFAKANGADPQTSGTNSIDDLIQFELKEFKIGRLALQHANVDYRFYEAGRKGPTFYYFKDVNFHAEDLAFSKNERDSARKFYIGNTDLNLKEYEYRTGDSLYFIGMRDFNFSSKNKNITIGNFYVRPRLSEKAYETAFAHQRARNEIRFDTIRLEGVELLPLIEKEEISIQQAVIGGGFWRVYLNRIPPLPARRDNVVPSQRLLNVSSKLSIAKLKINNLQLNYREYNTDTREIGEINFNDITGTVTNITNEEVAIEKNPHLEVDVSAKLMGSGSFTAKFDFLLNDSTGKFSVYARLGRMDATKFNPGFIPLNKLEIKKGVIDELICKGTGNQNMLSGSVGMLYHDLHVAVLKKDDDTLKRRGLVSLMANILVKNDNPKEDEPVRKADNMVLKRDSRKSYFNLLWMALFTGIVKIVAPK